MTDPSAIRKLIEGVTEGPWEWLDDEMYSTGDIAKMRADRATGTFDYWPPPIIQTDSGVYGPNEKDRAFIAAARTLVPQLLDEVERLTRERDEAASCQAIANNLARTELARRERAEARIAELEAGMGERK